MLGVSVNGKSVTISTGSDALAAIDTGTTLIGGPTDGVQAIWAAVPGSQALSGQMEGFFAFREFTSACIPFVKSQHRPHLACTTSVQVSMSFGGKSWAISTDDMNLGTVGDGLCLGGIFDLGLGSNIGSGSGNPSWVVGDTFLVGVILPFVHTSTNRHAEKCLLRFPRQPAFSRLCSTIQCRRRLGYVSFTASRTTP